MLKSLSLFMVWVLCLNSVFAATADAFDSAIPVQAPAPSGSAIKQRVIQIPIGSAVEVRLTNQDKLRGQLGGISDEGIDLKYARASHIEERKIAFSEIKSIKVLNGGGAKAGKVILYILAGAGAFMVVMIAIFAAAHT